MMLLLYFFPYRHAVNLSVCKYKILARKSVSNIDVFFLWCDFLEGFDWHLVGVS